MTASLGPSNDDSDAVRVEMRAAKHLADLDDSFDVWDMGGGSLAFGYSEHLPETWSWDISRPLAEQFAETAADDAEADRLVDEINQPVGNAASAGTTCTCGHAVEEHGNDPEFPGSTACGECPEGDCIAYESDGAP